MTKEITLGRLHFQIMHIHTFQHTLQENLVLLSHSKAHDAGIIDIHSRRAMSTLGSPLSVSIFKGSARREWLQHSFNSGSEDSNAKCKGDLVGLDGTSPKRALASVRSSMRVSSIFAAKLKE